jgi:hypothetical protein
MAHRKPRVPRTTAEVCKLLEREDVTAIEQHRALVGAILVCAERLHRAELVQHETGKVVSRMLDILLKQHGTLLLDLTDPQVQIRSNDNGDDSGTT